MASGFLFINKPPGLTSHDVVDRVRRVTGEKHVGHSGTLDPFAQGLLIVGLGRQATRALKKFLKEPKSYFALMRLGAISSTDDPEGDIRETPCAPPPLGRVKETLQKFCGQTEQIPPTFSAIKVGGKKSYERARKGQVLQLKPRQVEIYKIELKRYEFPELEFEAEVSSGTYIRALARDIGRALGCGGYLIKLIRLATGRIRLDDAIQLDKLQSANWISHLRALPDFDSFESDGESWQPPCSPSKLSCGRFLKPDNEEGVQKWDG